MHTLNRDLVCHECGHRAPTADCQTTGEGPTCPRCGEPGGMTAIHATRYRRDQLDVFEMDDARWFWAVAGKYPTGPFDSRDAATEDAEDTVQFTASPARDIDAQWVLDLVPVQATVLLLCAVAALALMALEHESTWTYLGAP